MRYAESISEVLIFVFFHGALVVATSAQTGGNASAIDGTVSDPSGAVVPNATVTIHNPVRPDSNARRQPIAPVLSASPTFRSNPYHPRRESASGLVLQRDSPGGMKSVHRFQTRRDHQPVR